MTYGHFFEELAIFKGLAIIYELRDNLTHKQFALMVPSLLKETICKKRDPFVSTFPTLLNRHKIPKRFCKVGTSQVE